jgi:hypothetical protein
MSERNSLPAGPEMLTPKLANVMTNPIKAIIAEPVIIEDGDLMHLH